MEMANEANQLKDDPINISQEFKSIDAGTNSNAAALLTAMANNTTNDETQPLMLPVLNSRNGDEITEMESPKVSNQVADEPERRSNTNQINLPEREQVRWSTYWQLCKMIEENKWERVKDFVGEHPQALTEKISITRTMFHYLIDNIRNDDEDAACLIENLASTVNPITLEQNSVWGLTPLIICADAGNTRASKILVKYDPDLPNIAVNGLLPVHRAAVYCHKDTVQYLIQVTAEDNLKGGSGATLISYLILSNFYDIAIDLLKRYPLIGRDHISSRNIVLETLAEKPLAFASGSRLGRLQRFIYNCIPVKEGNICFINQTNKNQIVGGDVENSIVRSTNCLTKSTSFGSLRQIITATFGSVCQKLRRTFWNTLMLFVPCAKVIHEQKVTHMQTFEILSTMCEEVVWNDHQAYNIPVWWTAARFGIFEIVNEIIMANNQSIYWLDAKGRNVFHVAILHRQEKVFNLIYRIHFSKHILSSTDKNGNNMLHLAAMSKPSSEVAGAALQMQRELQWFKAVEDLVHPASREKKNGDNKTPREVFTTSHKDLVKEGEEWMKYTASSCTLAVTLIITVVFAAAFTVPGGNNSNGSPTFLNNQAFLLFVISDALALFSSTTSLLMFLGILTSRYAEDDFLISLPRKLIIGLITLFLSVAGMIVAFGATIYLVLSHPWKWVSIPISVLGCVPVTLFALLQFPLLLDMVLSTYGPSIFGPNK